LDSLKKEFLLNPNLIYLNHGSFGATPRKVFNIYQDLQRELENQPVAFLGRDLQRRMTEARQHLAAFLKSPTDSLAFVSNATTAINIVARNLKLGPGDEVLATDHEYGAMDRTWRFMASRRGFDYIRQPIPTPIESSSQILDYLWEGVTPNTRVVFVSHITSPTGIIFPVEEICKKAKEHGFMSIIDGAHAPGHIALDLSAIGADFYAGNLHKWLCAPKGSGFLYANPDHHPLLEPLIVSWGWESEEPGISLLIDHHEWQGTRDPAAWLAVPEAICFQEEKQWDTVRQNCHSLALETQQRIAEITDIPPLVSEELFAQMVASIIPWNHPEILQKDLLEQFKIEVPVYKWNEHTILRTSFQAYNSASDIDSLMQALEDVLPL
jgi:isopenicillin-N epimerase